MTAARSWRAIETKHPDVWTWSGRRLLDVMEALLYEGCTSPEEVTELAAYLADPDRAERERNDRHLALLRGVADIG